MNLFRWYCIDKKILENIDRSFGNGGAGCVLCIERNKLCLDKCIRLDNGYYKTIFIYLPIFTYCGEGYEIYRS